MSQFREGVQAKSLSLARAVAALSARNGEAPPARGQLVCDVHPRHGEPAPAATGGE
jgi:hypothetical protein